MGSESFNCSAFFYIFLNFKYHNIR